MTIPAPSSISAVMTLRTSLPAPNGSVIREERHCGSRNPQLHAATAAMMTCGWQRFSMIRHTLLLQLILMGLHRRADTSLRLRRGLVWQRQVLRRRAALTMRSFFLSCQPWLVLHLGYFSLLFLCLIHF